MDTNQACLQCHPDFESRLEEHTHHRPGSSGSECYNCHMSHTSYALLKSIRSHQISSPTVAASLETGRPNACNQCHLDKTLDWAAENLQKWYGVPRPKLSREQETIAASVLWTLKGDAGQRALMAWSLGWEPARAASGSDWMAPYLAQLLEDPYDAVRFIAYRSLRRLPGFSDFRYDYVDSPRQRAQARLKALEIWRPCRPATSEGKRVCRPVRWPRQPPATGLRSPAEPAQRLSPGPGRVDGSGLPPSVLSQNQGPELRGCMIKRVLAPLHVLAMVVLWVGPQLLAQSEDYRRALASFRDKRYLEALVRIQQAVAAEDDKAAYYLLQGEVYSALRQFSDAEASLRRAVELEPDLARAHFQLAVLFLRDNKYRRAATALERVAAVEPGNLRARLLLASVYCLQLNLDSLALQQFAAVAEADPRYPALQFGLGRLLFRQGRDGEAVERFRSELESHPEHAEARFHLAKALLRMGRGEEVVDHLQALRGKKVDQAELHFFLAKTYHRLKQPVKAIEALLQGIDLKPDFPDAHYLLARLYLETGRPRDARRQMDRFEEIRDREGRGRLRP